MPSPAVLVQPFAQRLHTFVTAPRALTDLQRYFGISRACGTTAYTGGRFEHLAGGGDRPDTADRITAADLVAVQTLPRGWRRR
ncbi:DUF6308 family protein [Streptomyces xanthophaeus]|uniref:DUF6308 family protein n=1 Tax=Streptomyces xanthophaeus TaxID=67385 RepID=UPI00264965BF|nr:DUF6308 family protein [Streptomyces xanthophaeus]WKD36668.1 hypothetical protein KO717_35195 [Streptomyces xanthophaeus]